MKQPMNMAQAKARLMELAANEYHSLSYEVTDCGGGRVSQKCKVYISGRGWFEASHWDVALQELEASVLGRPVISEDLPVSSQGEKS